MTEALSDPHLPPGRTPVAKEPFRFQCHPGVSCYLTCCRNVDMLLFPYDILRLKQRLALEAGEFLRRHTTVASHIKWFCFI